MSFHELRVAARRVRHAVLSSCASYSHAGQGIGPEDVHCKLVNKLDVTGDLARDGYPDEISAASFLRFSSEELDQRSLILARGGVVTMPDGSSLILDVLMPTDGPINVIWRVAQT